jgi:hypothetical protein
MKTYKVTVDKYKTICWYNSKDQLHREDGPAVEWVDGTKYWYINGKLHREDGPAIECADGYKESKLQLWYHNNKLHREDGPAVEYADGPKYWYRNHKLHREDGPAVEGANGTKFWYINDKQLTEAEFNARTKSCDGRVVEIDGKKYKLTEVK